jgi:hypothetical protein
VLLGASDSGNNDIVEAVLNHGADIDGKNKVSKRKGIMSKDDASLV